ncbi:MAG: citrate/2-methylcitrate synthase [Polyangiales bacterium]
MTVQAAPADGSLEGVIVARTAIAHVDGLAGRALIRGYLLQELAAKLSYEDVAYVVLKGELPANDGERALFQSWIRAGARMNERDCAVARSLAEGRSEADALSAALVLTEDAVARAVVDPIERCARVMGRVPSVVAAVAGFEQPPVEWSYARRSLAALGATRSDPASIRAVEVLLNLESEHGLSASTFACRVAASSGANAGPTLAAACATLSGERHGGATARARAMLEAAVRSGDVPAFIRAKHGAKERLPGFGHRVYKVADPRVPPMREAMRAMGHAPLLDACEAVAEAAAPLFAPKGIHPNIDLYGSALLGTLGVDPERYVAAFALGISCGWLAHWAEVRANGRLVRPDNEYSGPAQRALP